MSQPIYKRVLLKASGEALMGSQGFGIDVEVADRIASDIADACAMGVEVGVVVGGGNIFRGVAVASKGGDRVTGDHMGMLGTVIKHWRSQPRCASSTSRRSSCRLSPCRRSAKASRSVARCIIWRRAVW